MKKTAFIIMPLVAIILHITPAAARKSPKITKEKKIHRQYAVQQTDELDINNTFGNIQVNTWDKEEITVDITMTAKAESDEKAADILDHISMEEEKMAHKISFISAIQSHYSVTNDNEARINYVINMPRKNAIDVINKFGNVSFGDFSAKMRLELSFGSLITRNITGQDKKIKISFGSGSVPYIETGNIKLEHSNMDVDKAGNIHVDCSFGKFSISTVENLDINQKFGNLEIGTAAHIDGDVSNSDMNTDELQKSGDLTIKFCGRVDIKSIGPGIESLKVDASYSSLYCHFEDGANLLVNMEIKFGDFKNRTNNIEITPSKSDNNTKYYKGKIGKGDGTMTINSNFGNVFFK